MAVAQVTAVLCGFVASRGKPWWNLDPAEVKELAKALDPPLARIPIPEKELGVVAELGALGFVCFAIFAPRMQVDKEHKKAALAQSNATHAVVAEAERIAAAHADAPYAGTSPLDRFIAPFAADGEKEDGGITVGETDPNMILRADRAARESGLTPETIVGVRRELGDDGDLLDAYNTELQFPDGSPLPRGLPGE